MCKNRAPPHSDRKFLNLTRFSFCKKTFDATLLFFFEDDIRCVKMLIIFNFDTLVAESFNSIPARKLNILVSNNVLKSDSIAETADGNISM